MKLISAILVIIGGGTGAFSRYGVTLLANRFFGATFPVGTLLVNLTGCLLIGVSFSLVEQKVMGPNLRIFFVTGFLGGLTTFSTYAVESIIAGREGMYGTMFVNLAANNIAGLILVIFGLWLGRLI